MIYVKLRSGHHGCGVVGDSLCKALSALAEIERIDFRSTRRDALDGPLLERLDPRYQPSMAATRNIAYAVLEQDVTVERKAVAMQGRFDALAPASEWCGDVLRRAGLTNISVIPQAVEHELFNSRRAVRDRWRDRFVVFSGGKLELRKA